MVDVPVPVDSGSYRVSGSKRVLVLSDTHCGARTGLTPPGWQDALDGEYSEYGKVQREAYSYVVENIEPLKPIDLLIANGDLIDGRDERAGGLQLLVPDRLTQAEMARQIVDFVGAEQTIIVQGTPYHTGKLEEYERIVAKDGGALFRRHAYIDVNGIVFSAKHKIGGSQIPHGRFTASARDKLWGDLWSLHDESIPRPQIQIRSHVHYFDFCGGKDWLAVTTPGLQTYGSKFGELECSGTIDFGFIFYDIYPEGQVDQYGKRFQMGHRVPTLKTQAVEVVKV